MSQLLSFDVLRLLPEVFVTSKIRIKMGAIEVEYEGSEDFLRAELPEFLSAVSNLYYKFKETDSEREEDTGSPSDLGGRATTHGTTANIAAKLKCDSGPDLALAAAAHLTLVKKFDSFTRTQLLQEMKSATSFYSKSMSNNLSSILTNLVKNGKFKELSTDTYALAQADRTSIEAQLGND